jgi:hypothetical protein
MKPELYDNVCSSDFKIICLTETWLSDSFINQHFFPELYTAFHADRVYNSILHGGGVLIATSDPLMGTRCQSDLELYEECVRTEISMSDGFSLLTGNHYSLPDTKVYTLNNYFSFFFFGKHIIYT